MNIGECIRINDSEENINEGDIGKYNISFNRLSIVFMNLYFYENNK